MPSTLLYPWCYCKHSQLPQSKAARQRREAIKTAISSTGIVTFRLTRLADATRTASDSRLYSLALRKGKSNRGRKKKKSHVTRNTRRRNQLEGGNLMPVGPSIMN
ncbi:hypothetical protein NPIL_272731 [Nephila pilipes]|uniref:Uncharacterized protein n=1 Tax=Nephila pilipes TaxID=299642 RepID=A0A8X6UT40_NEPPI|nr:hypothetical protein NPIL_272731 [Nephila pilipes]